MINVTSGQLLTVATSWDNYNSATGSYVSGSGSEISNLDGSHVYSAGVMQLNSALIHSGGYADVQSGGVLSNSTLASGGVLYINNGAESHYNTVSGTELIAGGGSADNAWITDGGSVIVDAGALLSNTQLDASASAYIYGVSSDTLLSNSTMTVENGGRVYATDLNSATLLIDSGGFAGGTNLLNGGRETIFSGGVASNVQVYTGSLNVSSGGMEDGLEVHSGGLLSLTGGSVLSHALVDSGGIVSGLVVSSGSLYLGNGSNVIDGITLKSGAQYDLEVKSGAAISGYTNHDQVLSIDSGALARGDKLLGDKSLGTTENVSGVVISSILSGYSTEEVVDGGITSGSVLNNHSTETVEQGGISSASIINNQSTELVSGTAINTTVNSGGTLILAGGLVSGGSIAAGGILSGLALTSGAYTVSGGALTYNGLEVHSGAKVSLTVNGATLHGFTVSGGQTENVAAGVSSDTTVNSGGTLNIYNTGQAINTLVNSGGSVSIFSGTVVKGGSVASGGSITGLELSAGSLIFNQGNASLDGITLHSGAAIGLTVDAGAVVSSMLVMGQTENIYGSAVAMTLNKGSYETIYNGGFSSASLVNSGSSEQVSGSAMADTVNSGGTLDVLSGGSTSGVVINSGGLQVVSAGGVAIGSVLSGGAVEFSGSGDAADTLIFAASGGVLKLDNPDSFSGVISGFAAGDSIDLTALKNISTLTLGANNVLTVLESNRQSFNLQLAAKQNFTGDSFYFTTDGGKGEDIRLFSGTAATLSSVAYNAATGLLTLNGSHLSTTATTGVITPTALSLSGDSGSYTLTGGSVVSAGQTANSVALKLSAADQLAVDALLNRNGGQAYNGTAYSLSASSGWDTGAAAISKQALTVSQAVAPSISAVSYNAASGVFSFSGSHLQNGGSGLMPADFKLFGSGGSYSFNAANDKVSNWTDSGFSISLNAADRLTSNGAAYHLAAAAGWDAGAAALAAKAVTVSGVPALINSVSYDAASGHLSLLGKGFSTVTGNYTLTDLTLAGYAGGSYTLVSSAVSAKLSSATDLVIQVSATDQLAVEALLNRDGGHASDNTVYGLSATAGWDSGKDVFSTQALTVSNLSAPALSAVSYNESTGKLVFTGSGFVKGVNVADLSLSGGSGSFSVNSHDTLSGLSTGSFTVTLSSSDKVTVNSLFTANGNAPVTGAAYKLVALADWDGGSAAAIAAQVVTVAGYAPTVSSVAYNAASGVLTLTGSSFTSAAANYLITDFVLKGNNGASYTLTNSSGIVAPPTVGSVSIQLSASDQLAVDALLDKAGTSALSGTLYNLSAKAGWDTAGKAISNGITVSNVGGQVVSEVSHVAAAAVDTMTEPVYAAHGGVNDIAIIGVNSSLSELI
jgi:autotransporter passenger strand-loop-strand repeat protein